MTAGQTDDSEAWEAGLARLRAGEVLWASWEDIHGLEWPIYTTWRLSLEGDELVLTKRMVQPGPADSEYVMEDRTDRLSEPEARRMVLGSQDLRRMLGLR